VLPGTDPFNPFVVPGASLHEELALFVAAGFTAEEAWAAATWQAGEALGHPEIGRLEAGAPADLLLFREDPTRTLAALATLEAVIAGGRLYPRAVLDAAVEASRAYFARPPIDRASTWAADAAARRLAPVPID
jgi:predicted amidohydrolase